MKLYGIRAKDKGGEHDKNKWFYLCRTASFSLHKRSRNWSDFTHLIVWSSKRYLRHRNKDLWLMDKSSVERLLKLLIKGDVVVESYTLLKDVQHRYGIENIEIYTVDLNT